MEFRRPCNFCHKYYPANRATSRYCSGACRAKARRKANGAIVGDPGAASARRNATKAQRRQERVCLQCGQAFMVNGKQGRKVYCSTRCKKRAFYSAHAQDAA